MNRDLIATYLNDHLAAATAGVELVRRAASSHEGDRGAQLNELADEVAEDRETLRDIMKRLDVAESTVKKAAGRLGERAGRLKPNDHLVTRSPLSDVLEIEMLRAGTAARICGFQVLRAVAVEDGRLSRQELEGLIERADRQAEQLYKIHVQLAQENLAERSLG